MAGEVEMERTLEETATWSVAVVCFVLVLISILLEHLLHIIGKWLKNKHKTALYEAVEKIKAELMLMGFISLLLTILQTPISSICVPRSVAMTWRPCKTYSSYSSSGGDDDESDTTRRKLLGFVEDVGYNARRSLATKGEDKCTRKGKVAFVTAYGIHQLHVFIFILATAHIIYCILTLALGRFKMRKWKAWEEETKTLEYQYYNDPERFRFARDTSFGRRHLNYWSKSSVSLWIVCFFRQFFGSVTKVDYMTLRHGFIAAHLAPGSETKFDFQKYIKRSLEEDFKVVVGITPVIWFIAMLFLLTNTNGWHSYYWLPAVPLIIVLLVGTKLQVIITKMGLRIQDRGDVVRGTPIVQPGDDLFWFGRPRFILFLIHVVLFQNAFQMAFFVWSTYQFGIRNCFHQHWQDIAIRVSMGLIVQFICSYVTMPLYALVTQMGSTMRPTIFNDRVAAALKKWHHTAKKQTKHGNHSESTTPFSSMPPTPSRGMSPIHLLQNYPRSSEGYQMSPPRVDNFDNEEQWYNQSLQSPRRRQVDQDSVHDDQIEMGERERPNSAESDSTQSISAPTTRAQHEIDVHAADFSFSK